jgi:hypothetical protein
MFDMVLGLPLMAKVWMFLSWVLLVGIVWLSKILKDYNDLAKDKEG